MKNILVTGGLGYIGSHTVVELYNNGYNSIIVDNLSNSKEDVIDALYKITNNKFKYYIGDCRDYSLMDRIFKENDIYACIHFAGLKAVGESVIKPIEYYKNNIDSTITLIEAMRNNNCKKLIFSSSATVYGSPDEIPIKETTKLNTPTNPYGKTKLFIEHILNDLYNADKEFSIVLLRYFNPVGAHSSALIGENPNGIPNNLVPYVSQVAKGLREYVNVFGSDYNTKDGTGVRDYIHVVDLAIGHVLSIKKIEKESNGLYIYNLGTGNGYSVLDVIKEFSKACNKELPYKLVDRRPGDVDMCYSDPTKAEKELGFKAKYNLFDMVKSQWVFEQNKKD